MARVLVPLAEGFEEIETATIVDVLRRGGVEVVLAGLDGATPCKGACGMTFVPDVAFADVNGSWDLIALPGGMGGSERLAGHPGVQASIRRQVEAGRPVAAICAAPMALDAAGVLEPHAFTCFPGIEARFLATGRSDRAIVDTGTVITSQGPGTAMAFALHLVRRLAGDVVYDKVRRGLLYTEA